MNKDNEFYLVIAIFLVPLIFSTIDFTKSGGLWGNHLAKLLYI